MSYKILHFADLHLDASFAGQGFSAEYGRERRLDLRSALTRIFAQARELNVNAVTVGGNLFVQENLLPETADFIQQQLTLLAPIRVIIAPGSQDPYTNESPYARLNWPENVDIFYQGKLSHLELAPDIHLWGASNPPTRGVKLFDSFQPAKGFNILLLHARAKNSNEVHSVNYEAIQKAGFHCALLGGESQAVEVKPQKPLFFYPGTVEPLTASDEEMPHQIAILEIIGENVNAHSVSLQQWHYVNIRVDLTNCISNNEAAQRIDTALKSVISKTPHSAITVTLTGIPPAEFNMSGLHALIQSPSFYRLESEFSIHYDLTQIAREQTVRGLLVQRFLERINNAANEMERSRQLTALNFALQALEGKQVSFYETKTS